MTDRRHLNSLHARGWVEQHEVRRSPRSRRTRTVHVITLAGRAALDALPVEQPPPRPDWSHWGRQDRERLSEGRYLVCGHELYRPARGMLWRLLCQVRPVDEPVTEVETLAEAVDALTTHLHGWDACTHTNPTGPRGHHPADHTGIVPHPDPDIVDLDGPDRGTADRDSA